MRYAMLRHAKVGWSSKLLSVNDDIMIVNEKFNVMVVTKFAQEDYVGFLKDELPLDTMQHIVVTTQK